MFVVIDEQNYLHCADSRTRLFDKSVWTWMSLIYVDMCKCFLCNKSCVYCVINVNVDSYPGWLRLWWALKSIKLFRKFIHSILQSANNFIGNNLLSVMSWDKNKEICHIPPFPSLFVQCCLYGSFFSCTNLHLSLMHNSNETKIRNSIFGFNVLKCMVHTCNLIHCS